MDIEKEDGQNDYVICQLKSTDAQSIKVNQKDIRVLEKNANSTHKLPMFAIQFLNTGEVWLMVKPENIVDVSKYLEFGKIDDIESYFGLDLSTKDSVQVITKEEVKSSSDARKKFHEEENKKYDKTRKARN